MPRIVFTEEEVRNAFPTDLNGGAGTPRAWSMYSDQDGAAQVADFVNDLMVKLLTVPTGMPYTDVPNLGEALRIAAIGCVRGRFNYDCFGLSDTAAEERFYSFARNLLSMIDST